MKNQIATAILASLVAMTAAPSVMAQDTASGEKAAPASSFSDADIKAYAGVALKINKIQADAALSEADKQKQMAAAVQSSGMDVAKFNAITEASKSDPALKQKLQDAARP